MVKFLLILFFLSFRFATVCYCQNTFLDDINLLDNERKKQIVNVDTNNLYSNSFFIRSTNMYQTIKNKQGKLNYSFQYDKQNNSKLPISQNDGIFYPAKGWQERYTIGVNFHFGILDLNLQPEKLVVQNLKQDPYYGNKSDGNFMFKYFGMIANNIDNFRQFGYDKIDTVGFGQSRIGLKNKKVNLGFSSENIWWGPGRYNSIVFTNNAGGFKHYYINSTNPIQSKIGNFEFSALFGNLDTTKFKDIDQELLNVCRPCKVYKNLDERNIDAITLNYQPVFLRNIHLGFAYSRQYYKHQKNIYSQSFSLFSKDRPMQKIGSFMFRFVLPKDKSEFYGEIGIMDKSPWPWKFFKNRERNAFILGVSKYANFFGNKSFIYLNLEFAQFQIMDPRNIFYSGSPFYGGKSNSWYTSTIIKQGYSNNGQLLGSSIGPGSNSQTINLSWNHKFNKITFIAQRIIYNNDFYYSVYFSPFSSNGYGYYNRYWVDINLSLQFQFMPFKNLILSTGFFNTNSMNYRWIREEDGSKYDEPSKLTDKYNQQFQLSIKYLLNAVF